MATCERHGTYDTACTWCEEEEMAPRNAYAEHWDHYVDVDWNIVKERRDDVTWPGDEWGTERNWEHIFRTLFAGVQDWRRAVEIGQGSGKYTLKVLGESTAQVRAYDVSAKFLDVCRERCGDYLDRLDLRVIDTSTPRFLFDDLQDWHRELDALYSIDAMVHVDLQYLMAYLIAASARLREGGKLILTLATPVTDGGFDRLVGDVSRYWKPEAHGTGRLEWVSACTLERLLPRLGFQVDVLREPPHGLYAMVVATLTDTSVGDELAARL